MSEEIKKMQMVKIRSLVAISALLVVGYTSAAVPAQAAPFLYVTNSGGNQIKDASISVIDIASNKVVKTVAVEAHPNGIATEPGGKFVWVTNYFPKSISIIDTLSKDIVLTIPLDATPAGIAFSADYRWGFIVNGRANSVLAIYTGNHEPIYKIPTGMSPHGIAVTPDGKHAYVTIESNNGVAVLEMPNANLLPPSTSLPTKEPDATLEGFAARVVTTIPTGLAPRGIAVDSKRAYVANMNSGNVSVVDTATNACKDVTTVEVSLPQEVAVSPKGEHAYVTSWDGDKVVALNTTKNTTDAAIKVGKFPLGMAVAPDGRYLYVANSGSDNISVVNTATNTVDTTIKVGVRPQYLTIVP